MLPTGYRHVTDTSPTVGQLSVLCRPTASLCLGQNLSANCRSTVGRLLADSRPTNGQQLADSRPTGFLGSSSSQLLTWPMKITSFALNNFAPLRRGGKLVSMNTYLPTPRVQKPGDNPEDFQSGSHFYHRQPKLSLRTTQGTQYGVEL